MVAKIISGKNINGVLNYNEKKVEQGKAELIWQSGFHKDIQQLNFYDKVQRFNDLTIRNERTKTNAVHISLNFAVGEKIHEAKLIQIANQYLDQIDFGNQPYLVYLHKDAGHPHIHIVTTNIKPTGERISLHNLGRTKSEEARKNIEIKYGLVRADHKELKKQESIILTKVNYGKDDTKRAVSNVVRGIVDSYKYTSIPELNAVLSKYNVQADRGHKRSTMYAKNGLLYWALDKKGVKVGVPIKASSIYGSPTLKKLEPKFESNRELRKPHKEQLKNSIDHVLKAKASSAGFQQALSSKGIDVVFRRNEQGRLYGVTYIDHNSKTVFNGSDLGKAYSANALSQGFLHVETTQRQRDPSKETSAHFPQSPSFSRNLVSAFNNSNSLLDDLMRTDPHEEALPEGMFRNKRKKKRKKITN
ncbi:relaxase/mobilization nuclease domain-containing protein [Albibacterium sp.]|uniref:relaxase/mobilization nuclease domain-containing protein n=1 Tax=Albibacterium sp. TaxID=2952885 RepID=UPI002B57BB03|nr:relaxase/mobilization nuclease domain-containing protein [Albibacterium sp.]HUH19356.1 relaxase/mobilization nuclease domain-containing protein [Albibacterium sp.]